MSKIVKSLLFIDNKQFTNVFDNIFKNSNTEYQQFNKYETFVINIYICKRFINIKRYG